MADLSPFIAQYSGQTNVGDTDANRGQCVGLVEVYTDSVGAPHDWGNADQLLANADQSAFTVTFNSPTNFPQPGDVVVWGAGWEGSAVGHCAIVVSADVNTLTVFEQNDRLDGGDGACRVFTIPTQYTGVLGWMRPNVLNVPLPQPSQPVPVAPTPTPSPSLPEVVPTPSPSVSPSAPVITQKPVPDPDPVSTGSGTLAPIAKENWFFRLLDAIYDFLIGEY